MNPFKKYETDHKKEREGVRIEVDDMVFICKRAGGTNRGYRAATSMALMDPELNKGIQSDNETESLEAQNKLEMIAFVDAVVIGWENVLGRDDQPLEFNKTNLQDLFHSCPEIFDYVRIRSQSRELFRREEIKKAGEALGNTSGGIESTEKN